MHKELKLVHKNILHFLMSIKIAANLNVMNERLEKELPKIAFTARHYFLYWDAQENSGSAAQPWL